MTSLQRCRLGLSAIAIAMGLAACGSQSRAVSTTQHHLVQAAIPSDYLAPAVVAKAFRAHGILLQKTFGDNLQSSYDGISTTALGLHVVGLIIYPPPRRQGNRVYQMSGGVGDPIVVANVSIWIDPGLSERAHADAEAAIAKLKTECHCENPSMELLGSMVPVKSGEWSGRRWTLLGVDVPSHQYCVALTSPGLAPTRERSCGTMLNPQKLQAKFSYIPENITVAIGQGERVPDSLFGVVVSSATNVEIRFTNGTVETVPTIRPPAALRSGLLDFYLAPRPCGATYATIVARDAHGKTVALARRVPRSMDLPEAC